MMSKVQVSLVMIIIYDCNMFKVQATGVYLKVEHLKVSPHYQILD